MSELHILNGDQAFELWKECGYEAQNLVWRETYLEGPLPETDDPDQFRKARAEYLSHFAELADISEYRLYQYLRKLDETILDLPEMSTVVLWFDSCIFDQTLLMRILHLFNCRKNGDVDIFLYCCEGNCLTLDDFKQGYSRKVQLQPSDLENAAKAWTLFLRKDAAGLLRFAENADFERMPKMKKALFRCAEEIQTDEKGLNRTQRQIVKLVSEGNHTFPAIFRGQAALEEYPFLGDTACQRILDDLTRRGFLLRSDEGYRLPTV